MAEIRRAASWEEIRAAHRWVIPKDYNLAWDLCEKWAKAEPDRVALIHVSDEVRTYTARDLSRLSARLANVLVAHGIEPGDRIGILLPQCPETVVAHLAAYRIGAVVLPLFVQFGTDGLRHRLADSGARTVITDRENLPKLGALADELPDLGRIWCVDGAEDGAEDLSDAMSRARDQAGIRPSGPETPALVCYTSGTTGPPKGALHGHRVALGHVPGTQLVFDFWPQPGDRIWTPSDWAWLGGMGNVMMPALKFGVPLIAHAPARFDPEASFDLMARHRVTGAFLAPTALKMMREAAVPDGLALRAIASGGESLGASTLDWGRQRLGLTINEFYGQTECNQVLASNAGILPVRPGAIGKQTPGSEVVILREDGTRADPGEAGEIAIGDGDAAMFLGYWKQPERTEEKFVTVSGGGRYMRTGDEAHVDEDGYFWFAARTDDVITSSGYRVGPSEIEDCLNRHDAVALSACIGMADTVRTEVVKAFVVLSGGRHGTPELAEELKAHVRARLSPHVMPREIEWRDSLPMTETGKIRRRDLRSGRNGT